MEFYANLYSLTTFYTNLTEFMLDLKFYAILCLCRLPSVEMSLIQEITSK